MRKRKVKRLVFILLLVLLAVIFIIDNEMKKSEESKSMYDKVLLIGIDAMDPRMAEYMMDKNMLPNFKKLSDTGHFNILKTTHPPETPVAWTTASTGTNPGKHNMFDFIGRNPETYIPMLSLTEETGGYSGTEYKSRVKEKSFWKILSENDIHVSVIRWPITFPPQEIKGNMLSGLGVPDIKGFLSGYSYYTSEILKVNSQKPTNKIVKLNFIDDISKATISGPKKVSANGIVNIESEMKIEILSDSSAKLSVSGKDYEIKKDEWSEWISVTFDAGLFNKVKGIFKVYLINSKPFSMYATAVQINPANPVHDISYPNDYSKKLSEKIGLYYTLGMPEETDGFSDGILPKEAFVKQIMDIESEREKMFWAEFELFNKKKKSVLAFGFDSSDRLQHMFWDEKNIDEKYLRFPDIILNYYKDKDRFIGEILKEIDERTLLIIFSDHGFSSFERAVSINTWLVKNNYMTLTKDINEIDDDGAIFKYVDWSKTKAYSLGFASLYINEKGRERDGIVSNKKDVVKSLISDLEKFTDGDNNVVHRAYDSNEIFSDENPENRPDIIIGFNQGYRMSWQNAIGGLSKEIIFENDKAWKGDHLIEPAFVPGVIFSNFKLSENADLMDIAPSVLHALGIEKPESMDGKILVE